MRSHLLQPNTKKAYVKDLGYFFQSNKENAQNFLQLESEKATSLVLQYKDLCLKKDLSKATINRRLSAFKNLVRLANQQGKCSWTLDHIKGEKIKRSRDYLEISSNTFRQALALCKLTTNNGKRNYAILRLLWENNLSNSEIVNLRIEDLDIENCRLRIHKATQCEYIFIAPEILYILLQWLATRTEARLESPLFVGLDNANKNQGLTSNGLYKIVRDCFAKVTNQPVSPKRIRF